MKNLSLLPALLLAALTLGACSFSNTEAAEVTCVFNGGPLDKKDFREATPPGSGRQNVGLFSNEFEVPLRLLTYQISLDPSEGDTPNADSMTANVGGMQMEFEPTIKARFNTEFVDLGADDDRDKPTVCELIEVHLAPFGATDFNIEGGVWHHSWLSTRFRPWVDEGGIRALQRFNDPVAMYFNTDGYRDDAADAAGEEITKELIEALGGNYFCAPNHQYGSDICGDVSVTLPQPRISDDDLLVLSAPQRARTEANAAIAEANEAAREAGEVAEAKEKEATFAKQRAAAEATIAEENARTIEVQTAQEYEWCRQLRELGEQCWLVRAAENGGLPTVMTGVDTEAPPIVIPPVASPNSRGESE